MNYEQARANTNKVIDFIERNYGREITDLERDLLNWLSDDEVLEFAENNLEGFKEDDTEEEDDVDLPEDVIVHYDALDYGRNMDEDEIDEMLTNYLSDVYGYCPASFDYEFCKDGIRIYDINWDQTDYYFS